VAGEQEECGAGECCRLWWKGMRLWRRRKEKRREWKMMMMMFELRE
jgi:hypothetical protein